MTDNPRAQLVAGTVRSPPGPTNLVLRLCVIVADAKRRSHGSDAAVEY